MKINTSSRAGALFVISLLSLGQVVQGGPPNETRAIDRKRLPVALQNVPLERLSSGALLRLDAGGDLVETEAEWNTRMQSGLQTDASASTDTIGNLDPRVGSNIRLGDDPPALPLNQRAQAEPHIARAPNNPDFLVATFQEGRFANGGAADCGYAVSHDGGLTWTRALIPNLAQPSGGEYERATDPVVAIDFAGNAYLNTLGLVTGQDSQGQIESVGTILVSRSTDGGNTFASPVVAFATPNADTFADKNWMAVNSFPGTPTAGRIVVTWTLFSNVDLPTHAIQRAYSDNGGVTWSNAAYIHSQSLQVQGSQPVFLPDGRLAIPYWNFNGTDTFSDDSIQLVVSQDGGVTFGPPGFITAVSIHDQPSIRDAIFLPAATTDRTTPSIYIVYQATHNGSPRVMFTKSSNAGGNWTTPIPISDNPPGLGLFNPAIAASPDGQTLTAVFYDQRNNPGTTTLFDMYLAQSFDGGASWQPNIRITNVSTNAALAVNTGGSNNPSYMLGDYLGVAEPTNPNVPAVPVWVDTRTGNPDPFIARIGIAPAFNLASWRAAHFSLGQINNPAVTGEGADPDGDGEDNSIEFNFQTDPTRADSVVRTGNQLNLSTRAFVQADDNNLLIGGFIITGSTSKRVIVRAIGPSLTAAGVPNALQNPTLELVPASGPSIFNDDWQDTDGPTILQTGLAPTDVRESAIVQTLAPGAYTALIRGLAGSTGVALMEVYDLAPRNGAQLRNLSSRAFVGLDDNVVIAGLIIGAGAGVDGAGSVRTLVRGIGPSLAGLGVANPLLNPELVLVDANGMTMATNNNWADTQMAEIQATGLAPQNPNEAAVIMGFPRGLYTAILRGFDHTTGVGLIEAYHID